MSETKYIIKNQDGQFYTGKPTRCSWTWNRAWAETYLDYDFAEYVAKRLGGCTVEPLTVNS